MGALGGLLPAIVPAVLADLHGERRAQAYAGQAIVAYAFGLAAPLLAGFAIWAELGWRAAVLAGVAAGIAIGLGFRRMQLPEVAPPPVEGAPRTSASLPPAYWAYWALLIASCALEFCLLFWAPSYLERIVGYSRCRRSDRLGRLPARHADRAHRAALAGGAGRAAPAADRGARAHLRRVPDLFGVSGRPRRSPASS